MVGLAGALGQVLDLIVFDRNLGAQKRDLAVLFVESFFELLDVLCRDRSRQVGACRCCLSRLIVALLLRRQLSRLVAARRDWSRQVAPPRCTRCAYPPRPAKSGIFRRTSFDPAAVQMTFGAIALNAARGAGKSGPAVALKGLIDGQRKFAVGACRDRSRRVVGHAVNDNRSRSTPRRLSPNRKRDGIVTERPRPPRGLGERSE